MSCEHNIRVRQVLISKGFVKYKKIRSRKGMIGSLPPTGIIRRPEDKKLIISIQFDSIVVLFGFCF